jgi:hypothetical protein
MVIVISPAPRASARTLRVHEKGFRGATWEEVLLIAAAGQERPARCGV